MNNEILKELLDQYLTGSITAEGKTKLAQMLDQPECREELEKQMQQSFSEEWFVAEESPEIRLAIQGYLQEKIKEQEKPAKIFHIGRMVAAASVILLLGLASWFFFFNKKQEAKTDIAKTNQTKQQDIPPGKNGAILTLDNGEQIILDSVPNGLIVQQGNSNIIKQGQELRYQPNGNTTAITYNIITTPKGRQYPNLVLADGSKVWLDAGSSIRFPVSFTGNERRIEVTGQVWFDVVHNDKMPFKVMAKGIEIIDLGTEFNVNAYDDEEKMNVTLLKGEISIQSKMLRPGQQAQISADGKMQVENNIDVDQVIAWKNGYFSFKNADLQTILRQAARWYDLEVNYEGNIPIVQFSGEIGRSLTLRQFLRILEKTRIHYKIEGKKIIVLP